MAVAVSVENLSKKYRLGVFNHGMLYKDIQSFISRKLGKPDPHRALESTHDVTKEGDFWALRNVSFQIPQGQRLGIIGRNGAGKSTLLKIISRITAPTEGLIKIHGRTSSLLEVGTGFHPELTGRENIYLNGAILGMKKRDVASKIDEIIAFSEIEQFIDTPAKRYSSGMYVRLAFAVAAHLDNDVLLADEVLAVGDSAFQRKCLGKMEEVSKDRGKTIIFVSHNLHAIQTLCQKVIVLEKGEIKYHDETQSGIDKYLSLEDTIVLRRAFQPAMKVDKGKIEIESVFLDNQIADLTIDNEINICVDFTVQEDDAYIGFTFLLFDEMEELVFSSLSLIGKENPSTCMARGKYRARVVIPRTLLNSGKYSVGLNIYGDNYTFPRDLRKVLIFEAQDTKTLRGNFSGTFGGSVRPALAWSIDNRSEGVDPA
jgi:lipopolysaccharide transport system ATP-binding protein